MTNSWPKYYRGRNCKEYQDYFECEYERFFDLLESYNAHFYFEAGCGISTVSKILKKRNPLCSTCGIDNNLGMLKIGSAGRIGNILQKQDYDWVKYRKRVLIHSHGVLEHFCDDDIRKIISVQKSFNKPMVHWVPTDAYEKPSFGDERLLSVQEWAKVLEPDDYYICGKGFIGLWYGTR